VKVADSFPDTDSGMAMGMWENCRGAYSPTALHVQEPHVTRWNLVESCEARGVIA